MKVAGSSRPRIRKSRGTDSFYPGSKPKSLGLTVLSALGKGREARGGDFFLVRGPCHRTRLSVFQSVSQAIEGARCEAQFPAGVGE